MDDSPGHVIVTPELLRGGGIINILVFRPVVAVEGFFCLGGRAYARDEPFETVA